MAKIRTVLKEMSAESKRRRLPSPYAQLAMIVGIGIAIVIILTFGNQSVLTYIGAGCMTASVLINSVSFGMRYAEVRQRITRNAVKIK